MEITLIPPLFTGIYIKNLLYHGTEKTFFIPLWQSTVYRNSVYALSKPWYFLLVIPLFFSFPGPQNSRVRTGQYESLLING